METVVFYPAGGGRNPVIDRMDDVLGSGPASVIEIGCGIGLGLDFLAARHPNCRFTGIDIEPKNIAIATARSRSADWITSDLLLARVPPADFICGHSVLQLVDHPVDSIARAASAMLRPGGRAIFSMPVRNFENAVIASARAGLRGMRSKILDKALIGVIRAISNTRLTLEELQQRLRYFYAQHPHVFDRSFAAAFAGAGLVLTGSELLPRFGIGVLRHVLIEFEKRPQD